MSNLQHTDVYVLGHQDAELARLELQGRFLRDLTRGALLRAGVGPGMRVLDFGAGAGDVSLIAAELVGPTGEVLGVDRSEEAVQRARARYAALGVSNAHAVVGDEDTLGQESYFDAVIGRLVLLHQRDPAATVQRLAGLVRPGGILAFHEIEIDAGCWSRPRLPLLDQAWGWIVTALIRGGMVTDIGARITDGFARAGVQEAVVMREGRVERGGESGSHEYMARMVRTMAPIIERMGIASAEELGLDTLAERLSHEAAALDAQFIPIFLTAAWGRRAG